MRNPDRVVVLNDSSVVRGGAGYLATSLARGLQANGVPVTFIVGDSGPETAIEGVDLIALGGQRLIDNPRGALLKGLYNTGVRRAVAAWIAANDTPGTIYHLHNWANILSPSVFDALAPVVSRCVVHAHDFFLACPSGAYLDYPRAEVCQRAPLSVDCIRTQCDKRNYGHKLWRLGRHTMLDSRLAPFRKAATFVLIHKEMVPWLTRSRRLHRMVAISNPVDPFGPFVAAPERNTGIFYIGQLQRVKGVYELAEAGRRLNTRIDFVGSGENLDALSAVYPEHRYHGWTPRTEVRPLLEDARATVVASQHPEPFCLSAFEGIATGLPLVLSDSILPARTLAGAGAAVLFEAGNVDSLTATLQRVLTDDPFVAGMAEAARARGSDLSYTLAEWVTEHQSLYSSLLDATIGSTSMKTVLFNCKYSENLGDGLIVEALEGGIRSERPDATVVSCDLAGRRDYGHVVTHNRASKLRYLQALPPRLRRASVAAVMLPRIRSFSLRWREELRDADLAIIGGGQLFQDDDLNFPLKVGALLKLCAEMNKPVAVHGVGVSAEWSPVARSLFRRLRQTNCLWISVRDEDSRAAWLHHFPGDGLPPPSVVPDPAMLINPELRQRPDAVGVNVVHPAILAHHIPGDGSGMASVAFYTGLVDYILQAGLRVVLFTNGASEDEQHLDAVMAALGERPVSRAPRARVPGDLVAVQSGFAAMVGYRLHASILSYRLGIPCVGLGWDRKLQSFYGETGRSEFFVPKTAATPVQVGTVLIKALDAGIDAQSIRATISAARKGLQQMLDTCVRVPI
ncbi:MAG: polysaccharide pyruvyl transferase family protein [Pararhodobacter sp.]